MRGRARRVSRSTLVQLAVLFVSGALVVVLWFLWQPDELERPRSDFAGTLAVGIGDSPPDTRVFFHLSPWSDGATARIVLGQSQTGEDRNVPFRIEFEGFLQPPPSGCPGRRTENTCWEGDGMVRETDHAEGLPMAVIEGTFPSAGFTAIDTRPPLGSAVNGPYSSVYQEVSRLQRSVSALHYPRRGVEVEISTGGGTTDTRYESFFPAQPYRLYPDGWAWLLREPGGPIGLQLADVGEERRLRDRSEIAGLLMGVFLALFVQVGYELAKTHLPRRLPPTASDGS